MGANIRPLELDFELGSARVKASIQSGKTDINLTFSISKDKYKKFAYCLITDLGEKYLPMDTTDERLHFELPFSAIQHDKVELQLEARNGDDMIVLSPIITVNINS